MEDRTTNIKNETGPFILKETVQAAIKSAKDEKVSGLNSLHADVLKLIEE